MYFASPHPDNQYMTANEKNLRRLNMDLMSDADIALIMLGIAYHLANLDADCDRIILASEVN